MTGHPRTPASEPARPPGIRRRATVTPLGIGTPSVAATCPTPKYAEVHELFASVLVFGLTGLTGRAAGVSGHALALTRSCPVAVRAMLATWNLTASWPNWARTTRRGGAPRPVRSSPTGRRRGRSCRAWWMAGPRPPDDLAARPARWRPAPRCTRGALAVATPAGPARRTRALAPGRPPAPRSRRPRASSTTPGSSAASHAPHPAVPARSGIARPTPMRHQWPAVFAKRFESTTRRELVDGRQSAAAGIEVASSPSLPGVPGRDELGRSDRQRVTLEPDRQQATVDLGGHDLLYELGLPKASSRAGCSAACPRAATMLGGSMTDDVRRAARHPRG